MLEIRKMEQQDLPFVEEIEVENFSKPWTKDGFLQAINDEKTVYLSAIYNGIIVGYVGMWTVLDEGEITNVSVKKEYQGQKIGKNLLTELIKIGSKMGILNYFLEVRNSNQSAQSLYKKLGFEKIGIRKNFYDNPVEDGIVMSKRI